MKPLSFEILLTFGILFCLLGLALFLLFPKAKRKSENYKFRQLEKYQKLHNKPGISYEKTGMYLPAWERMKTFAPLFFGILFLIIGVSFLVALK